MKVKRAVFPPIGNNCYLIVDENTNESALVDCSAWDEKMQELIGETNLKYILLTHGHYDHIGGVKQVQKRYNAKAVISSEDAEMLASPVYSLAAITRSKQECTSADITVKDGDIIEFGSIKIKVIATPGHTKGSVCYIAEDALFSGDTLFCGSCGRTDFPGGSGSEMIDSLRKLKALDGDYEVYPGHEDVTTLEYERKYNHYMNM